jgi:hypothetical protein
VASTCGRSVDLSACYLAAQREEGRYTIQGRMVHVNRQGAKIKHIRTTSFSERMEEVDAPSSASSTVLLPASSSTDGADSKEQDVEDATFEHEDQATIEKPTSDSDPSSLGFSPPSPSSCGSPAKRVVKVTFEHEDVEDATTFEHEDQGTIEKPTSDSEPSSLGFSPPSPSSCGSPKRVVEVTFEDEDQYEDQGSTDNKSSSESDSSSLGFSSPSRSRKKWFSCTSWSHERVVIAFVGCLSASAVLIGRLLLDHEPTAYIIHALVVFIDMILIHLFTNNRWLSISGEITTIVFFLGFHFTKETVFELLETTMLAALCSFHLILSRNKHMDREEELEVGFENLRQLNVSLLRERSDSKIDEAELGGIDEAAALGDMIDEAEHGDMIDEAELGEFIGSSSDFADSLNRQEESKKHCAIGCGKHFFEHFLDGSAGVMYTSFLGLIIDELLVYGEDKNK